ncbi:hypothetical protein [Streptomyces alkaliphilus]|uniref:hypothetical protein n=1 Tax=Streptomyces alkaliphilus TaxID=1472722 RepID=UPI0015FB70F4|nr:hypothetical protein [Streptomyces alkaliphilus]
MNGVNGVNGGDRVNGVDRSGVLRREVRVEVEHRGPGPPDGEIAVVRLLARMPSTWRYAHRATPGRLTLWIGGPGATPRRVGEVVVAALGDPALAAWHDVPVGDASDGGASAPAG